MLNFLNVACMRLGNRAATLGGAADDNRPLGDRTRQYLTDLIRLDTSNPPGNETRVAQYLKQVADSHGIYCELQGSDPTALEFHRAIEGQRQRPAAAADRAQRHGSRRAQPMDGGPVQRRKSRRVHLRPRRAGRQIAAGRRNGRDGGAEAPQHQAGARPDSAGGSRTKRPARPESSG